MGLETCQTGDMVLLANTQYAPNATEKVSLTLHAVLGFVMMERDYNVIWYVVEH